MVKRFHEDSYGSFIKLLAELANGGESCFTMVHSADAKADASRVAQSLYLLCRDEFNGTTVFLAPDSLELRLHCGGCFHIRIEEKESAETLFFA